VNNLLAGMSTFYKAEEIRIFTILKEEVIVVGIFLLVMRNFVTGLGSHEDQERVNSAIVENNYILSLVNFQLIELNNTDIINRMGLFDTFLTA